MIEQNQAQTRTRRQAVGRFLAADRTPMWVTMLILVTGAAGTYYLAPRVNAEFEEQKIKTDFVIRNYSDLRGKMEDFQGLYGMVSQRLAAGEDVRADVFKLQEIMGRISAQNLSMMPMFTSANGPKAASEVNTAMNGMLMVLFNNAGKQIASADEVAAYSTEVAAATQRLVPPLLELYVQIGKVGRLRPTSVTTDLQIE